MRVKDVGRVELGAEDYSSRLRFAGVEASGIGVQLLPSANAHRDVPRRHAPRWTGWTTSSPPG